MTEALRAALERIKASAGNPEAVWQIATAALAQPPAQPSAKLTELIAGALYDLMGDLTTRDETLRLGAFELATPACDALDAFAKKRGLSLDNPAIENWSTQIATAQPPAPTAQPAPSEFEETDPDTCEHYCPHCGGSGEVEEADSAGPDARMVTVFCPHCDGHGTLIAAYRGVVKLLYAEKRKYMKVLGEWYCLKHFAQPVQQPDPAIEEALVDGEFEPRHWTVSACRAIEQNPSGALNIIQTLKRQLAAAQKPVQQPGAEPEPIMVEAVAEVRSGAEGLYLDWLIEGGICALVEGCVLVMPTQPITDDDGSGEVYLSAPAQRQPLTVPALTDAQMSECAWGYVADSRNLDAGVTGIIQATQLACAAAWGVTLAQKGEKL